MPSSYDKKMGERIRARLYERTGIDMFSSPSARLARKKEADTQAFKELFAIGGVKLEQLFTCEEFKYLVSLDPANISIEPKPPSPGSFAALIPFSEAQSVVTEKLTCMAGLLTQMCKDPSKAVEAERLNMLAQKVQQVLRSYIRVKEQEEARALKTQSRK